MISMMIGILMMLTAFTSLFVLMCRTIGMRPTTIIWCVAALFTIFIVSGVYLITL